MEYLKQYKNILIGGGVLILVFGGFLYWKSSQAPESPDLVATGSTATETFYSNNAAGQQIINILNDLRRIKIDKSVFESAVFKSLIDYTIATTSEPIGRPDPFAPLPFETEVKSDTKK